MCQKDGCAPRQNAGKGVVQQRLGVLIQRRVRLLDDQQGRVAQDGAGQGNQKLLAAWNRLTHFADRCLISLRQILNELVAVSYLGGFDDLRQRVTWVATADVVGDRVVENQVVLQDDGHMSAQ